MAMQLHNHNFNPDANMHLNIYFPMKTFEETVRGYPDQEPPEGRCCIVAIAYTLAFMFGVVVIYLILKLWT